MLRQLTVTALLGFGTALVVGVSLGVTPSDEPETAPPPPPPQLSELTADVVVPVAGVDGELVGVVSGDALTLAAPAEAPDTHGRERTGLDETRVGFTDATAGAETARFGGSETRALSGERQANPGDRVPSRPGAETVTRYYSEGDPGVPFVPVVDGELPQVPRSSSVTRRMSPAEYVKFISDQGGDTLSILGCTAPLPASDAEYERLARGESWTAVDGRPAGPLPSMCGPDAVRDRPNLKRSDSPYLNPAAIQEVIGSDQDLGR